MVTHYSRIDANLLDMLVKGTKPIGAVQRPDIPEVFAGDYMYLRADNSLATHAFKVVRVEKFKNAREMVEYFAGDIHMPSGVVPNDVPAYAIYLKFTKTVITVKSTVWRKS